MSDFKNQSLSDLVHNSTASPIRDIIKLQSENMIDLSVGQLLFNPPKKLTAALENSSHDLLPYVSENGISELRDAIAKNQQYSTSAEKVVVTQGAQGAIAAISMAYINKNDVVLLPEIHFESFKSVPMMHGANIQTYKLRQDLSVDQSDLASKLSEFQPKLLFVNSPNNPTGKMLKAHEIDHISKSLHDNSPDTTMVSDEVYDRFAFSYQHFSAARAYQNTIIINSVSKSAAAAGLRLGWAIAPNEEIASALTRLVNRSYTGATLPSQKAALPIIQDPDYPEIDQYRDTIKRNRAIAQDKLNYMGLATVRPEGAIYCFLSIETYKMPSKEFSQKLWNETKVKVVPGNAFGEAGDSYIRISLAVDKQTLEEGLTKIKAFVSKF